MENKLTDEKRQEIRLAAEKLIELFREFDDDGRVQLIQIYYDYKNKNLKDFFFVEKNGVEVKFKKEEK